jgi:hypothetical protein
MNTDFYKVCAQSVMIRGLLNDAQQELKIFPILAPSGVNYPYIKYQTISANAWSSLNNNDVADSVRIQINIYSKSYQDAIDIFAAIRNEFKDLARIQFNHEDYNSDAFVYDYCFDLTFIQDVD